MYVEHEFVKVYFLLDHHFVVVGAGIAGGAGAAGVGCR